jgi:hypothetical protein
MDWVQSVFTQLSQWTQPYDSEIALTIGHYFSGVWGCV